MNPNIIRLAHYDSYYCVKWSMGADSEQLQLKNVIATSILLQHVNGRAKAINFYRGQRGREAVVAQSILIAQQMLQAKWCCNNNNNGWWAQLPFILGPLKVWAFFDSKTNTGNITLPDHPLMPF